MRRTCLAFALILAACAATPAPVVPPAAEAVSLLGKPLVAPPPAEKDKARLEADLAKAEAELAAHPDSVDAQVWHARRLGYLGRYREAVAALTKALETDPREPHLLRHRGHRYITLREFEAAGRDLQLAARVVATGHLPDEVEPDGAPSQWPPHSTLQGNIHYHAALSLHLRGMDETALHHWRRCMALAQNAESRVSATYWYSISLRSLGRHDEADKLCRALPDDIVVNENKSYWLLVRAFDGRIAPRTVLERQPKDRQIEDATTGFGLVALARFERLKKEGAGAVPLSDDERARLQAVVDGTPWTAFGHIAAEAWLARFKAP
jgi:tetratricopeptide (TPR) repeat protein